MRHDSPPPGAPSMTDRFGVLYDSSFGRELPRENVDLVEVIADRLMFDDRYADTLEILDAMETVFHCLNLSLGSVEPLDPTYMENLSQLVAQFRPRWISDHLAFTRAGGVDLGQLSPIRLDTQSVIRIAGKVAAIQDELGIPFLIENIAYYFQMPGAEMSEGEFLHHVVERTGCGVLLDVNNVAVNAVNHGLDPESYIREFPLEAVGEIHIAGHRRLGPMCIDSHGEPVADTVWDLLRAVSRKLRCVNVILERDQNVPPLPQLLCELDVARTCVTEGRRLSGDSAEDGSTDPSPPRRAPRDR
jgi:uncharacterized protein (UPF0276 family)